ncbi:MAG: succinylglutamate desuccinylase/aspartoacylase family protein [Lachnospiraceae bacterium]|nr:succinylglutamate desuccinylase/aspartoacylase family protein [Lachnospiraceae bacterium]
MHKEELYRVRFPYREDMVIQGFRFGKGDPTACILGAIRGNEIQQMYICSQLIRELKELEMNGCINAGKSILVIPVINGTGLNISKRFFGVEDVDINRDFPGREGGDTTDRIACEIFEKIKEYTYGIQLTSFYMVGEFVPHVRMMETGYQNTSLANLFGLPYVVVRKPSPLDTKTLNYNWQNDMTAAFSLYSRRNDTIDDESARQALSAVLRFLTRMGIIRYESHSGFISHVIMEDDLTDVYVEKGGIFRGLVKPGEYVRYGYPIAEIRDPYEGFIKEAIIAPTSGIVFFAHTEALISQGDMAYRLIHRLHQ